MCNFLYAVRDIIVALLRLVLLQRILFVTGVNNILFNRTEIANVSLVIIPQRRDRDRLAFVDDLKANNFDLLHNKPLPPAECPNFTEDKDAYDDDDIIFEDEDDEIPPPKNKDDEDDENNEGD